MAIRWTRLIRTANTRFREWADALTGPIPRATPPPASRSSVTYERLRKVVLTDEVSRTLFDEYAEHRATDRGLEETGWILLGVREVDQVTVLATIPAGTDRDAGESHVRFDSETQNLAARIVRQSDRRLTLLGVVHTHPGTLRHPSRGDWQGDRDWVANLRGGEGVFGIGTVSAEPDSTNANVGGHPTPHTQTLGSRRFDWYTLATGDTTYHPAPVELTIGPDLAAPLRPIWDVIEAHAVRLDRLARQFASVRFECLDADHGPTLLVKIGMPEPREFLWVLLHGKSVRFIHDAGGELTQPDLPAGTAPDHGVFLLLAELAARK